MHVYKRDGTKEVVSFDKVLRRIQLLSNDLSINCHEIAQKICNRIYDGVKTSELDELTALLCCSMIADNPDYDKLGSRIMISNHQKKTSPSFSETIETMFRHDFPLVSEELYSVVQRHKDKLNSYIDYTRDFLFDCFGFKTLERAYLIKVNDKIVERPQHMFMRVALGIHGEDIKDALETYDAMSTKRFLHATPTLFNFGTPHPQGSSCFLLHTNEDSIDGIYRTLHECAMISKYSGGIGLHIHNVRAKSSWIRGTNGKSDGIIPMLRVFNSTARYVNQCFTPETMITTRNGPKPISEIIPMQDEVITIDGTYKQVLQTIKNDINKEILEVRCTHSFEPIRVTKEHEIYVLKNQQKGLNYNVIKNRLDKGLIHPKYISAKELSADDLVGFPKFVFENTESSDDIDFYRFYGIMLGDGHITKRNEEFGITVNLDSKLCTYEFVVNYLNRLGIHYWTHTPENANCIQIRFSKCKQLKLNRDDIYDENDEKYIKASYFSLNKTCTAQVLKGLLETDGSIGKEIYFHSTSYALAHGVKHMCYKLGILTSGYVKNEIGKSHEIRPGEFITSRKIAYVLRIPKVDQLRDLFENIQTSGHLKYFEHNGIMWTRIKTICPYDYNGSVYDLNIEDNHNYLVSSLGIVHNSGKRNGSMAIYLEPWHADVEKFLDMRKNHGNEEERARDLFYALWIPDLFMERVKANGVWSLMCPDECQGLTEVYGDEFKALYERYEREGRFRKQMNAQSLWIKILESQIETGTPYMLYKDHVNRKTNQSNLGIIKSSNLCVEIMEYTSPEEIAVCNLASLCLPSYVNEEGSAFDFEALGHHAEILCKNLNKIIDRTFYPVDKARRSNLRHRPIGIGVQGLSDVYMKMRLPYEGEEAKELNKRIFETIYYYAMRMSMKIAKKRAEMIEAPDGEYGVNLNEFEQGLTSCKGAYSTFSGSPLSEGKFQFDLWGVEPSDMYDWAALREDVKTYGARNSLLLAPMPTASTSQIMGFTESFEIPTSNIYKRKTLAGEFIIINKYLIADLIRLKLWNREMKDKILIGEGSIQHIEEIPEDIRALYKTAWEVKQSKYIDQAADRAAFICQSQSMNIFLDVPDFNKLNTVHFYTWKKGLKTGMYYLRTKPRANTQQFTIDPTKSKKNYAESTVSSNDESHNNAPCESCSA